MTRCLPQIELNQTTLLHPDPVRILFCEVYSTESFIFDIHINHETMQGISNSRSEHCKQPSFLILARDILSVIGPALHRITGDKISEVGEIVVVMLAIVTGEGHKAVLMPPIYRLWGIYSNVWSPKYISMHSVS